MRKEIRYTIDYIDYVKIIKVLEAIMKKDKNSEVSGRYSVRTIYLDNYYHEIANNKKNDINSVNKYRIRMYNRSEDSIYLERKMNENGFIKKTKVKISKQEAQDIIKGNIRNFLEEAGSLKTELYINMRLKHIRPVLLIDYERTAFVDEFSNTRVTLETNIKSTMDCTRFFSKVEQKNTNHCVLEIKYDKYIPEYIKILVSSIERKQITNSKNRKELDKFQIWG